MVRFLVVFTICATAVCMGSVGAMSPLDRGIKMATKSMQGVCWYEFLKRLPDSSDARSEKFGNCFLNTDMSTIEKLLADQNVKGEEAKPLFTKYIAERSDEYLPKSGGYSACSSLTKDPEKEPEQDYTSILKDGGKQYPFRAFAHCLVGKLKSTYGPEAMTAMEEKWKYSSIPWKTVLKDRENENRARHGSGKLRPSKELYTRAQRWADNLAKKCAPLTAEDHINDKHPDYLYKNTDTGESIAQGSSTLITEDSALSAANSWYEEVKSYPWPTYTGNGQDSVFSTIGHFTAQVWKGSQEVGYGLGKREGCDKVYVVARYWPAGNQIGVTDAFKNNIGALQ